MKYIVCEEPGRFELKEKEIPQTGPNVVLIAIRRIGICGTDLHAFQGNQPFFSYPRVLGHELGAEVISTGGEVSGFETGDHVLVMPYLSCNKCIACRKGKTNCCTNISVLGVHSDGGMQEQIAVPADILIQVNDLSFKEIALIEPLAIGAHAIRRADINTGEFIVVIGCGPIGLGIMKLAQIAGAKVIAVDIVQSRLDFAKKEIGVDFIITAGPGAIDSVSKITNDDMATKVFDASGNKAALESGTDYMSHGGTYILVGLSKGELTFTHPKIHAKETSLLCSRNATKEDFESVIATLRTRKFPVDSFVTHEVTFEEMIENFSSWLDPNAGVIKAMVTVD